jgi:hypothetical protein
LQKGAKINNETRFRPVEQKKKTLLLAGQLSAGADNRRGFAGSIQKRAPNGGSKTL